MTKEQEAFLTRINQYAEKVMADIDPQKTPISVQLENLRPIMETIAAEQNRPLEDIFIEYMDLASEAAVEADKKLQAALDDEEGADFSSIANRLN